MIKSSLKPLALLALPFALSATLNAQTTTDPVGVVQITITGAASEGGTKLTAISATLRNGVDYQGAATSIGTFFPQVDEPGDATYEAPDQPLNTGVTTWSATEWTTEPHLCYVENAAGAEEAYLITENTTGGQLTLSTTFDIKDRYTATPTFRIVKAQTLGSLFGTSSVPFKTATTASGADNLYAWEGNKWTTYHHNGSSWQSIATAFGGDVNDTVIFPDEGLFILRRSTSPITVTLNGSVPTKAQISTIPGGSLSFVSTRYPVNTTLNDLGFHNLTNWTTATTASSADLVYVWDATKNSWFTYWHNGSSWQSIATAFGGNANDDIIKADSAMFVQRRTPSSLVEEGNTHQLPYTTNQ